MTAMQRDELLIHIDKQVNRIEIQLEGNGNIGVFERLRIVEDALSARPQECPFVLKHKSVLARRAMEVSIMGVILATIVGLMKVFL